MNRKTCKKLTDLELEIMNIIWKLEEATISEVNQILNQKKKKHAYTTTATMMKILEKKKYLKSRKKDRAHKFIPILLKNQYEDRVIVDLVDNVFEGVSANLVLKLIDETKFDRDELDHIRQSLESRMKND